MQVSKKLAACEAGVEDLPDKLVTMLRAAKSPAAQESYIQVITAHVSASKAVKESYAAADGVNALKACLAAVQGASSADEVALQGAVLQALSMFVKASETGSADQRAAKWRAEANLGGMPGMEAESDSD